mgnify:CR=1 FL=1
MFPISEFDDVVRRVLEPDRRVLDWVQRSIGAIGRGSEEVLRLPVDIYTTTDEIVVQASLPGLSPEDVDITLREDRLTISGQIRPPLENVEYVVVERAHGKFSRTLVLNVPVEAERIEAKIDEGILTLVLPKAPEVRPKVIHIDVNEPSRTIEGEVGEKS